MSPKERILMLRLYEKVSEHKEYAEQIGVEIIMKRKDEKANRTIIRKSE